MMHTIDCIAIQCVDDDDGDSTEYTHRKDENKMLGIKGCSP
jgi:hypothetical protein